MTQERFRDDFPKQLVESTSSTQKAFVSQALQILIRNTLLVVGSWKGMRSEVGKQSGAVNRVTSEVGDDIVEIHGSPHREDEMVVTMVPHQEVRRAKWIHQLCLTEDVGLSDTWNEKREDVRLVDASGDELEEIDRKVTIGSGCETHTPHEVRRNDKGTASDL